MLHLLSRSILTSGITERSRYTSTTNRFYFWMYPWDIFTPFGNLRHRYSTVSKKKVQQEHNLLVVPYCTRVFFRDSMSYLRMAGIKWANGAPGWRKAHLEKGLAKTQIAQTSSLCKVRVLLISVWSVSNKWGKYLLRLTTIARNTNVPNLVEMTGTLKTLHR